MTPEPRKASSQHLRAHRHTEHVEVNTALCEACGRCVEACRNDVLRIVGFLFHKHVMVNHAEHCRGCLRCVRTCEHGAIRALRPRRQPSPPTQPARSHPGPPDDVRGTRAV